MEGLAATADHAARAKAAAVAERYWADPFAQLLTSGLDFDARPGPLINRGQYARVAAMWSICEQFLKATREQPSQIVSLGAGFDSLFWQLHAAGASPRLYVELDQPDVVRRKCSLVAAKPALRAALGPEGSGSFHSPPCDYSHHDACLADVGCGWCPATSRCLPGDAQTPCSSAAVGRCGVWEHQQRTPGGMPAAAAVTRSGGDGGDGGGGDGGGGGGGGGSKRLGMAGMAIAGGGRRTRRHAASSRRGA